MDPRPGHRVRARRAPGTGHHHREPLRGDDRSGGPDPVPGALLPDGPILLLRPPKQPPGGARLVCQRRRVRGRAHPGIRFGSGGARCRLHRGVPDGGGRGARGPGPALDRPHRRGRSAPPGRCRGPPLRGSRRGLLPQAPGDLRGNHRAGRHGHGGDPPSTGRKLHPHPLRPRPSVGLDREPRTHPLLPDRGSGVRPRHTGGDLSAPGPSDIQGDHRPGHRHPGRPPRRSLSRWSPGQGSMPWRWRAPGPWNGWS
jgi:hypothetical protein